MNRILISYVYFDRPRAKLESSIFTLKEGAGGPDGHGTFAGKLAEGELEEEQGNPGQKDVHSVGNQKRTWKKR